MYTEHKMQCGHCNARFTDEQNLSHHLKIHEDEMSTTWKFLRKHYKEHVCSENCGSNEDKNSSGPSTFKCEICSLAFLRRFDLKKHKIKHHSIMTSDSNKENSGDKKCVKLNSCEPKHEYNDAMEKKSLFECHSHYASDSDDSTKGGFNDDLFVNPELRLLEAKYFCSSCDYSCKMKRELTLHKRNCHSFHKSNQTDLKRKPHCCELCRNSYVRKADLQRHILKFHVNEEFSGGKVDSGGDANINIINQAKKIINGIIVYSCGECGKNLRTKKGFVRHVRVHTGERPFTCHICGKQYRSNTDLSRHLKCVHEGIKKYQCDLCGQSFATKATKSDHRRTHTGEKPYMCDVCGKSFPTPNSIYIHRRIHTNHFPHECKTCEKKFRRKQQLIHHTRTHTGEKPHACDVCGKCFAVKDEVTRHKITHSNEKPYICPNCGFTFAQKRYLTNHIKTHHPGLV
jgi:KRAB domain-containing zinc finger protein